MLNRTANKPTLVGDRFAFMYQFLRSPLTVGSITPSSRYLARAMAGAIDWSEVRHVVELGAGTGAITAKLQAAAHSSSCITLFERDPALRRGLQERFPSCRLFPDAALLTDSLHSAGLPPADAIVSGLPFFNFPRQQREQLLAQIASALRSGGRFVAFQYSLQLKRTLQEYFTLEQVRFVPWNVPSAFVYCCRKA